VCAVSLLASLEAYVVVQRSHLCECLRVVHLGRSTCHAISGRGDRGHLLSSQVLTNTHGQVGVRGVAAGQLRVGCPGLAVLSLNPQPQTLNPKPET